jgi:hypothetical protein
LQICNHNPSTLFCETMLKLLPIYLLFVSSHLTAQVVKFKFELFDAYDSSRIDPKKVSFTPRISHRAYHNNSFNEQFVKSSKTIFNEKDSSFTFQYNKAFYRYSDIFLHVNCNNYYFEREWEHDYDESDCINLAKHSKFYLLPFRHFVVKQGKKILDSSVCVTLTLKQITENGDTIMYGTNSREVNDTIYIPSNTFGIMNRSEITSSSSTCYFNEKMTLGFLYKYLLSVDICSQNDCYYADVHLFENKALFQTITLDALSYQYMRLDEPYGKCQSDARGQNCFSLEDVIEYMKDEK